MKYTVESDEVEQSDITTNDHVILQEKSAGWNIAKTILLLCIMGTMMGLLFSSSTSLGGSAATVDVNQFVATTNATRL